MAIGSVLESVLMCYNFDAAGPRSFHPPSLESIRFRELLAHGLSSAMTDPYRPPATPAETRAESSAWPGLLILAVLIWCALTMKVLVLGPFLRNTMDEFGVTVPLLTQLLIHPMASVFFLVTTVAIVSGGIRLQRRSSRRNLGKIGFVLGLVAFFVTLLGMMLPLWQLAVSLA